jgi:DNA-binding MarR family transcriptional regulator
MSSSASRRRLNEAITSLTRFGRSHKLAALHAERSGVPLNFAAYSVLGPVVAEGSIGMGELGRRTQMQPNALSRQVRVLTEAGCVERRADPADGRASVVVATEEGRAAHRRLRRANEAMLARQLEGWSDDELDALSAAMERLVADLRRQ